MKKAAIQLGVSSAKERIAAAENSLGVAIAALNAMPRAEKVTITTVVESAFVELKAAQVSLEGLEALLSGDDE